MSNVINWRTWGNSDDWVEHTAVNQPELDVTYEINNTELSGFTSLYNTGIQEGTTLPASGGTSNGPQHEYTFNNGYIWPYIFRRNTNNRHYFKTPNTIENKVEIKYGITGKLFLIYKFGGVGSPYATDEEFFNSNDAIIFDTDTLQARVSGYSVRGDALQTYDYLDRRLDPETGNWVVYWNEDYASTIFLNSCKIRVIDKINHNEKEIELIARNLPYGYSAVKDATIYCTFIVLNNFNPKYSYDNGRVYNTKVIQKYNDEYRYDNQEGQFIYPIFGLFNWNELTTFSGNRLHVQSFIAINNNTWSPNAYILEGIFSGINVNNGQAVNYAADLHFYNDWNTPQQTVNVSESTCVDNCRDMLLDYYYVPVAYNNNSGSYEYYISGITLGEIPPEPEPDPEDFDPEVNYPETPEDIQNTPTPETPQDTSDLLDALKGYIDGQIANGNFDNEDQKASDTTNGTNGLSLGDINITHYTDYHVYVLNRPEAYEMQGLIAHMVTGDIGKMLLSFNENFSPQDVIIRVLELPFAKKYIDSLLDSTSESMPAYNGVGLCFEPKTVNMEDFMKSKAKFLGGTADDFIDFANDTGLFVAGKLYIPGNGTAHWYQQTMNRFVEIDYKSVTVKRIFGNYLDYTDVKYKVLLPQGDIVNIDPNLLFRGTDGSLRDESVVSIKGILDLESGVMLLTIYINGDMLYQTSLDMGVERSLYGKSDINALRGIMKAITASLQLATMGASMAHKGNIFANTKAWPSTVSEMQTTGKLKVTGQYGETLRTLDYNEDPITRVTTRTEYNAAIGKVPGTVGGYIGAYNDLQGNYVEFSQGKPSEEAKIIANQIPQFIYEYPEIMIPKQGPYSNPGPWDYTFNYFDEVGMASATTKIGKGFNQFGTITNIDLNWSYSWSHEEIKGFKESLLNGFYIHDEEHIYRSPAEVYTELFDNPDRYIYSTEEPGYIEGQGMSQGYENTNSIVLLNVFSNWEKYIDRFHPDNLLYSIQGGHYYICYECTPYRDMNIDNPIIDISSEVYTHQNTAIWNGRIYRVVNVDYLPGHIVRLYLQEDYITTWYYFGVVEGIITRSSSYGIGDMADSYPRTVRRIVKKDNFLTSNEISKMFDGTDFVPDTNIVNGSTYIVVTAYDVDKKPPS